ncbi:MAG: hypothetical protein A49_15000 [Methyloceanibacter sp.]|nr:MAG: hypothetical protein A49_15000 [Methyloceanibacter sp.]
MFRLSRLLTAFAVLAVLWFFWPFGGDTNVVHVDTPRETAQGGGLFTKPLRETEAPGKAPTGTVGEQAGDGPDEKVSENLAAVDAKGDGPAPNAAAPKSALQPKRFYRVEVRDGGSLKAGGATIVLEGIKVEGLAGTCKDKSGQDWPCGRYARAALTRLIRGRAVICHVPISGGHKGVTARCTVGGTDISRWMVRQGWAVPASQSDAKLVKAADNARERKLGIWR